MPLPENVACLKVMGNPGARKVNHGLFEDFQIIPGRGRKAGLILQDAGEGLLQVRVRSQDSRS